MHRYLTTLLAIVACAALSIAQRADGQYWPCNPVVNATGSCTPNQGLNAATYTIDFTKQTSLPDNWTISNYATVNYGAKGAEFTFAKRYDAPQIWTDFYILFGRVEVVMQVAPGQGIISSSVLISDDFDEIDLEFSGNDFGNAGSAGMGQNNYFGKGITGNYDRGQFFNLASPQSQFHTYTVDWSPTKLTWSIDGTVIRTLYASDCTTAKGSNYQYPQTPSKLQLGLWDGGDAGANQGTLAWAGGYTNISLAPFTFYVKSVSITNANPAYAYNYTDQSGTWQSIQMLKAPSGPVVSSTSSTIATSINPSSASNSVIAQISSSLSSVGAQFAGTTGTPSLTASSAKTASSTSTTTSKSSSAVGPSITTSKVTSTSTAKPISSTSNSVKTISTTRSVKAPGTTSSVKSSTSIVKTTCTAEATSKTTSKPTTTTTTSKAATATSTASKSTASALPAWIAELPDWMREHIHSNGHGGWYWW